jgi:hypothetical protein
LHPVDPQTGTVPPGVGLPARASCGETIASRRNKTRRRRGIIFIVVRGCASYYLFTGESNSEIAGKLDSNVKYWEIIADRLSKSGWSWGCVAVVNDAGRGIFVVAAKEIMDNCQFLQRYFDSNQDTTRCAIPVTPQRVDANMTGRNSPL